MGKFFVNPTLLWGAAAVAIPLAIFLLNRFRYRTIDFAALVFLQRALQRRQRRLKLENLLLLLLRCLIVCLIALALARPRSEARVEVEESDKRHNIVMLLDTSYSTGYQIGSDEEETCFQRERRAAKDLISGLTDGDRVLVFTFDEVVRELYSIPRNMNERGREEITQELDDTFELKRTWRGTDLAQALHVLPRALLRFEPNGLPPSDGEKPLKKTVFLLTDAQRRGFLDAQGRLEDEALGSVAREVEALGGQLVLVDCGAEDPVNVSITELRSREPVVGQELPCHLETTVRNWSAREVNDLTVEYYVDGAADPQKTVSLALDAREERSPEPLRYVFHTPGPHHVRVRLRSDALQVDNERHVVVDVRESVRVLLVDGDERPERWESETDFIYEVLALSEGGADEPGLLRPEVISSSALVGYDLRPFDVVMLCNVDVQPDDQLSAALESYARQGGALVFTLGDQVNPEDYTSALWRDGAGVLPCALGSIRGGTREEAEQDAERSHWEIALASPQHPTGAVFSDEDMGPYLRNPSIYGFFGVELEEVAEGASGAEVVFGLVPPAADDAVGSAPEDVAGAAPLLVERGFGRGRAVLWTTSVDYDWNNLVLYDGFFVPFWRQLVLDLAQRSRPALNLPIGGRYERLLEAEEYSAQVEVEVPDGRLESVVLSKVSGEDRYRLAYPPEESVVGVEESGLYTVRRQGVAGVGVGGEEYFAVRLDTDEGDLTKFTAEELGQSMDLPVQRMDYDKARETLLEAGASGTDREYWRWVVAALLVCLAVESLFAAWTGRNRA